jgi:D-3-phosphoglycerate dehydrogenase
MTKTPEMARSMIEEKGYVPVFSDPGVMPDPEQLRSIVADCVGWIAGVEPIGGDILDAAPKLRAISRNGVGTDNIDLDACKKRGIEVLTTPGANAQAVTELTFALLFAAARHIPFHDREIRRGNWARRRGIELSGKHIGTVGYGQIGHRVAQTAACLGMQPIAYDVVETRAESLNPPVRFAASVSELIRICDVVTLHCPPTPDGSPVIDEEALQRSRPGIILINTARAQLVDETAVLRAIDSGIVSFYCADVFREEPPQSPELLECERTVLTPHIGGLTSESTDRVTTAAIENLLHHLEQGR